MGPLGYFFRELGHKSFLRHFFQLNFKGILHCELLCFVFAVDTLLKIVEIVEVVDSLVGLLRGGLILFLFDYLGNQGQRLEEVFLAAVLRKDFEDTHNSVVAILDQTVVSRCVGS